MKTKVERIVALVNAGLRVKTKIRAGRFATNNNGAGFVPFASWVSILDGQLTRAGRAAARLMGR